MVFLKILLKLFLKNKIEVYSAELSDSSIELSNGGASDEDSNEITDWPPFRKVFFCFTVKIAWQMTYSECICI